MNRPERLLEKARGYLADMETFLCDPPGAITVLLDALPHADTKMVLKIIPLLGYAGKDRVLGPLYHLVMEESKNEQVRSSAAVQLGLAASMSDDPSALKADLIENLSHPDPAVRRNCALALGWEGNGPAVEPLMAHLPDPDRDVQAAVVAALSSVGDGRVFDLLAARLETGTVEEQRSVLLNLWRFAKQFPRVEKVYLDTMETISSELRLDALCGLAMVPLSATILHSYRRLLADQDPCIRRQVLENLAAVDPVDRDSLGEILALLLTDEDARVRQAAIRLFADGRP